jgi:hypothetical protein
VIKWLLSKFKKHKEPKVYYVKSADVCKVEDKVYKVSVKQSCSCHECTSGFTTFKTKMKFKTIKEN